MDDNAELTRQPVRLRGRSYVAFVFAPVVPIIEWLAEIDATLSRSPGFFIGKLIAMGSIALMRTLFSGRNGELYRGARPDHKPRAKGPARRDHHSAAMRCAISGLILSFIGRSWSFVAAPTKGFMAEQM